MADLRKLSMGDEIVTSAMIDRREKSINNQVKAINQMLDSSITRAKNKKAPQPTKKPKLSEQLQKVRMSYQTFSAPTYDSEEEEVVAAPKKMAKQLRELEAYDPDEWHSLEEGEPQPAHKQPTLEAVLSALGNLEV